MLLDKWGGQKLQFVSLPHWLHFSGLEASAVKAKLEHEMYRLTFDPSVPFALLTRQVNQGYSNVYEVRAGSTYLQTGKWKRSQGRASVETLITFESGEAQVAVMLAVSLKGYDKGELCYLL